MEEFNRSHRHKLIFEFDGTNFNGWQKQPEGRTVQGVIEKALATFYQEEIQITGQGRTDAGVHAKKQVAHADLPNVYKVSRLYRAMSGLLPDDVALIDASRVNKDFHARFHAISRKYEYKVIRRQSPLMRHYCWSVFKPLSPSLLNRCAEIIEGEHDFINFCIPSEEPEKTTKCTIHQSKWEVNDDLLIYHIEGNRFLRHLVRRLVGSMIHVADGTMQISNFQRLLSADKSTQKAHTAPAKGLTLISVNY